MVIRRRDELGVATDIYVVTNWPDAETVTAGPFESYADALEQARGLAQDGYTYVWFDYARHGEPERLDRVAGDDSN